MKVLKIAAAVALTLAAGSSFAEDLGITVRAGVIGIALHPESPDFKSNGPEFLTPQPAGITVGNAKTLLFGVTKRLTDHWDIDFVAGIPPEHEVFGRGKLAPYGVLAKVKQRAPTVFANYNFGSPSDNLRPFVGAGVNYTQFFDANSTPANDLATGGPTKINLTSSWGLAAQIGVNYKLTEKWRLCASVAAAKVKTDLKATTGSIDRTTTIDFKPIVVTVGVGYAF